MTRVMTANNSHTLKLKGKIMNPDTMTEEEIAQAAEDVLNDDTPFEGMLSTSKSPIVYLDVEASPGRYIIDIDADGGYSLTRLVPVVTPAK